MILVIQNSVPAFLAMQHQNDELFRNSFLGKLSPISGGFITENNAIYVYTGAQAEYDLGFLTITPSFCTRLLQLW